jgi:hypothetical protein
MADIDLSNFGTEFNIIGTSEGGQFSGVFDGNGKKIFNFMFVQTEDGKYCSEFGMFGYVLEGKINDLGLINPNIDIRWTRVGSLVGYLQDSIISNCYIEGGNVSGDSTVGGLIGKNRGSSLKY